MNQTVSEQLITIRDSTDADVARITEIYRRSVIEETASFELTPPDEAEMARRRDTLLDAGYPYLVAEAEGRVAGYAYAGAFRPRIAYCLTVETTVYVDPIYQRRGIARQLMERLIEICETQGFRQMIAIIGGADHLASIELHRALGFVDAGVQKSVGYKHGRWLDTVQLQRPLGEGDTTPPGTVPGS